MPLTTPPASRSRLALALAALVLLGAGGWYAIAGGRGDDPPDRPKPSPAVAVEVIAPRPGGLDRVCVQPGTVEPFESADLYAKVSGYLVEQTVDIGSRVKAGDVLARLWVPEHEQQVQRDDAEVTRAGARLDLATTAVEAAEADRQAATAAVAAAEAELRGKSATLAYRRKERDRIAGLAAGRAVEPRVVDEQEDQLRAAEAAEVAALVGVAAANKKEAAARARVKQAEADRKVAETEVAVARSQLKKSQALLAYAVITAPHDGVVTRRHFHPGKDGRPGDFVKAADQSGAVPLLTVERTDKMRVVVQIPDRDVPFVTVGDPAEVKIDALDDTVFKTAGAVKVAVSRSAASEDPGTRMMRAEVDLDNADGRLRRGMYGRVRLALKAGAPTAVRVPSAALVGKTEGGKATVRVVRGDVARLVPVRTGADTGVEVEVLAGLTPADRVIVRAAGPVEDGTAVAVNDAR